MEKFTAIGMGIVRTTTGKILSPLGHDGADGASLKKTEAPHERARADQDHPRTTILIPAYNEEKLIGRCLEHACAACVKGERIIMIDNASTDKTVEIASTFPKVEIIEEPRKGSLGVVRNAGLRLVTTEFTASLDADTIITESWLRRAESLMDGDPTVVCVSGPYRYKDLPLWQQVVYNTLTYTWSFVKNTFSIAQITGGNSLFRTESLRAAGGFDTLPTISEEDLRVALRMRKIGRTLMDRGLALESSGRRYREEGLFRVIWRHFANVIVGNFLGARAIKTSSMAAFR